MFYSKQVYHFKSKLLSHLVVNNSQLKLIEYYSFMMSINHNLKRKLIKLYLLLVLTI
jgi:hypothetical protein